MGVITKTVAYEDLPEDWREGLEAGETVHVTLRTAGWDRDGFRAAIRSAAGLWKDRGDELDELYDEMRERDRAHLEKIVPSEE